MTPRGRQVAALTGGAVAAVLLLVSVEVPWTRRGTGSSLAVRELADFVLSGTAGGWMPRWAGLFPYLVPLGGAVVLVGIGVGHRLGRRTAAGGLVAATVGVAVGLWVVQRSGGSLATGAVLAVVGLALGATAVRLLA